MLGFGNWIAFLCLNSVAKAEWRQLKWQSFGGHSLIFLFSQNQEQSWNQMQSNVGLSWGELLNISNMLLRSPVLMASTEGSWALLSWEENLGCLGRFGGNQDPKRDYIKENMNIMKEIFSIFLSPLSVAKEPQTKLHRNLPWIYFL